MAKKNTGMLLVAGGAIAVGAALLMGRKKKRSSGKADATPTYEVTAFNPQGYPVVEEVEAIRDFGMGDEAVLAYILEGPLVGNEVRYTVSIPEQRNVLDPIYDDAGASLMTIEAARGHLSALVSSLPSPYPQIGKVSGPEPTMAGVPVEQGSSGQYVGYVIFNRGEYFLNIPAQAGISNSISNGPYADKDTAFNELMSALQGITSATAQA